MKQFLRNVAAGAALGLGFKIVVELYDALKPYL